MLLRLGLRVGFSGTSRLRAALVIGTSSNFLTVGYSRSHLEIGCSENTAQISEGEVRGHALIGAV